MSQNITFYSLPQEVVLMVPTGPAGRFNVPYANKRIKVYKGVNNPVLVNARDQDRKPVNLLNKTLTLNLLDRNGISVLRKPARDVNFTQGLAEIRIDKEDLDAVENGLYKASVSVTDINGNIIPLYSGQDFTNRLEVEVIDGEYSEPVPTVESTADTLLMDGRYVTGPFKGDKQDGDASGLHTVAFYLTNFKGRLYVEASLDLSNSQGWFPVALNNGQEYWTALESTGIEAFNFVGNFYWVRFLIKADADNTGTVDNIMYRH